MKQLLITIICLLSPFISNSQITGNSYYIPSLVDQKAWPRSKISAELNYSTFKEMYVRPNGDSLEITNIKG